MDFKLLSKAISEVSDPRVPRSIGEPCDPVTGKCRKKKRKWNSVFPMLHPSKMGTPRTYSPGSANGAIGLPSGEPGAGAGTAEGIRPSRARVIHELKRSMGMVEYFDNHSWGTAPNPSWGGYSVPNFGSVHMRGGGPTIGGPGFQHDAEFKGGKYDLKKSPGLGFRTETAWNIWDKVLEIISKDKTLPKHAVLLRAMAKSGIHRGQIDPSELRLIEMGIEWYLTDPGAVAAKRGGSSPGSGGPTGGGHLAGAGAP